MNRKLIAVVALCAACLAAQGQSSSGTSQQDSSSGSLGSSSATTSGSLRPTGRIGHQAIQASKLKNYAVQSSSGENLGTIEDVIINPNSGRVDFAVLSLGSSGSSPSSPSSPSASTSDTSSSSGSGKQVAVPWSLLRPASSHGSSASSTAASPSSAGHAFTFNGEATKLQSAPTFDPNSDITQPSWRQSVFSYFGVSAGSATGGSDYPGSSSSSGSYRGSSSGSTSGSPSQDSSSSPDSSSSRSTP